MLSHLTIDNFAIADHLEVEYQAGMTAITGETGAGKSITLDAMGLALGDRADASVVRHGAERADINLTFDISQITMAQQWLQQRDLSHGDECVLRRVITREGRSRGFINGRPATLQDLKSLGGLLIDIHNQHAHQSLLNKEQQSRLLDEYAGLQQPVSKIRQLHQQYNQLNQQLQQMQSQQNEGHARLQLLTYQVEELDQLALAEGEVEQLEREQKLLANGEQILGSCQHSLALCREGELNVISILNQAIHSLGEIDSDEKPLTESGELLGSALIQIEEASHNLQHYIDGYELDPERLHFVEQRLSRTYDIARKHHCQAGELVALHQQLQQELEGLSHSDEAIDALRTERAALEADYQALAAKISRKRQTAAKKLQKAVNQLLASLAMAHCQFQLQLNTDTDKGMRAQGNEDIAFLISTSPDQAPQMLSKIASGGELSRISLAIQVATAETSATPTVVFDEVDVGIGGATAEVVGQLLRTLGERGQVLCVTHQPQVASKAHHHLLVNKQVSKKTVKTELQALCDNGKIEEIARMLGGIAITDNSRANAREMLEISH